jgi:hypothetical protein
VIRLKKSSEIRTYLVEPMFTSKDDAKAAACAQALSENVMTFLCGPGWPMERKITPEMRRFCNETLLTTLTARVKELDQKTGQDNSHLQFTYTNVPVCMILSLSGAEHALTFDS